MINLSRIHHSTSTFHRPAPTPPLSTSLTWTNKSVRSVPWQNLFGLLIYWIYLCYCHLTISWVHLCRKVCAETRMIVLPDNEDCTIVSSLFWTRHRNVTDGRTDRQKDICRGYYSGLLCEQCGRSVKSHYMPEPQLDELWVVFTARPYCSQCRPL